ncbi:MAG TPA: hypothetical protein VKB76_15985, partial [Ktedonobacterales bacterium]|nr:hypothetical protein [Ktedonobacterales bacterium]
QFGDHNVKRLGVDANVERASVGVIDRLASRPAIRLRRKFLRPVLSTTECSASARWMSLGRTVRPTWRRLRVV